MTLSSEFTDCVIMNPESLKSYTSSTQNTSSPFGKTNINELKLNAFLVLILRLPISISLILKSKTDGLPLT